MLGSNSRSLKSWPEPPRTPAREPKDAVVPDGVEEEVAEELGEAREVGRASFQNILL